MDERNRTILLNSRNCRSCGFHPRTLQKNRKKLETNRYFPRHVLVQASSQGAALELPAAQWAWTAHSRAEPRSHWPAHLSLARPLTSSPR